MTALSPLITLDQDSLRCPAAVYEQLRDEGVRYAPEVAGMVTPPTSALAMASR